MTITSIDQSNARASEYWAGHRRDDARAEWDDLTPDEQIEQIRLGEGSEFFDLFDADPTVIAHCPVHGPQCITVDDTTCDECTRDLVDQTRFSFDDNREWFA